MSRSRDDLDGVDALVIWLFLSDGMEFRLGNIPSTEKNKVALEAGVPTDENHERYRRMLEMVDVPERMSRTPRQMIDGVKDEDEFLRKAFGRVGLGLDEMLADGGYLGPRETEARAAAISMAIAC